MAILKLEPGVPVSMVVKGAYPSEGKFGPQIKFTDDKDNALFVSSKTAEQQLGRNGLTIDESIGLTLTFEKVVKDGRTFTNINANATRVPPKGTDPNAGVGGWPGLDEQAEDERAFVESQRQPPPRATSHAEAKVEGWQRLFNAYDLCFAHALAKANEAAKAGFVIDLSGLSAMTATLLIAGKERGLAA